MSSNKIWDFWANHYDNLWVQKYSLGPTREQVFKIIRTYLRGRAREHRVLYEPVKLLDVGCGTGQLIVEIKRGLPNTPMEMIGIDYSGKMIHEAILNAPFADFLIRDVSQINRTKRKFDIITCTHSLPYYQDQKQAIKNMAGLLEDNGLLILAHASDSNCYDKLALGLTKLTTGKAHYPSMGELIQLMDKDLVLLEMRKLQTHPLMPTILISVLQKKRK